MIAATPIQQLVDRFSNISKPVLFEASIWVCAFIVLGFAYIAMKMTSKPEPAMSRPESWVLRFVTTVVVALVVTNCFFLFSSPSPGATPLH